MIALTGGGGNDTFNVDSGSDTITDLATNDDLVVSSGATATANNVSAFVADSDTTNAGTATINAASGGSTINMTDSASGAYTLAGGAGVDIITGGTGNDIITGAGGNDDVLRGGTGNDTITGGADNDT